MTKKESVKPKKKTATNSLKDIELSSKELLTEQVSEMIHVIENKIEPDEIEIAESTIEQDTNNQSNIIKKRGRKPKGGKIVQPLLPLNNVVEQKPNVILHLKCCLKDLDNNNFKNSIESYHFSKNDLNYELLSNVSVNDTKANTIVFDDCESKNQTETKQTWQKLKILENNLHINNINDTKSDCFWCTCGFDNPPIYIPKHFVQNSYHVYGCFCSPECATAFLMQENIDSSAKFERYQLLNHIYSKVYEYKKNIKPAPSPYYMLDKYYGNLTIQEYRSLLKNDRLFLIVDKPLTRILPELHEDNDDFIINNKIIPSNNNQTKTKLRRKIPGKNNIVQEQFGLNQ